MSETPLTPEREKHFKLTSAFLWSKPADSLIAAVALAKLFVMDDILDMEMDDDEDINDLIHWKSLALHVVGQRFNRNIVKDVAQLPEVNADAPEEYKPKPMFVREEPEDVGDLIKAFCVRDPDPEYDEGVEMMKEIETFYPDAMFALEPEEAKFHGLHAQDHVVAVEAEIVRPLQMDEMIAYMNWFDTMDAIGPDPMPALLVVDRYGRGDFVNLVNLWHAQLRVQVLRDKEAGDES